MNRRIFLRQGSLALGAASMLNRASFSGLWAQDPFKIKMLRNDVGVFTEKGGTIAFLLYNLFIAFFIEIKKNIKLKYGFHCMIN